MNRKLLLSALAAAALVFTACGAVGKPDPTTITKKNEGNSSYSEFEDISGATDVMTDPSSDSSSDDSSQAEKSEELIEKEKKEQEQKEKIEKTVEKTMKKMSAEEKVGQLFIVRPDALETDFSAATVNDDKAVGVTYVDDQMKVNLDKYYVGGVAVYNKNITDESQLKTLIEDLQSESKLPLFVGVEEEGGRISTISNNDNFDVKKYESMNSVGKSEDADSAKSVGKTIGGYLNKLGFNLNFAPVADVYSNPENTIIGDRAFSSEPETAAKLVVAEIKGLKEKKIMSAVKHFPGHGDVSGGTNGVIASTSKNWVELMQCEIIPFTETFNVTDMVMVGHITAPKVADDGLPASLSKEMVSGKLRKELGYDGVVITDSMSASSIINSYNSGEAAVRAINAGVDIILAPYDLNEAYTAVFEAVESGTISEERLDESVKRILTLKAEYGLIK